MAATAGFLGYNHFIKDNKTSISDEPKVETKNKSQTKDQMKSQNKATNEKKKENKIESNKTETKH